LPLNWKEINKILDELALKGSFIRQITQPDYEKLVFDIYGRRGAFKILISMSNPDCRIHIRTKKTTNIQKPKRFLSFLRAHIKNSRILSVEHVNNDRIVKFTLAKDRGKIYMWIKLWAGASNIIVTDSTGRILETFFRRKNKKEVTGELFLLPEQHVQNKSFSIRELPGKGTFNEKIENYYYDKENTESVQQIKNTILKDLISKTNGIEIKLKTLSAQKSEYGNYRRNNQIGDIIKANAHRIRKGDTWLKAEDFFNSNEPVEIQLNPDLTPIENAEMFYTRYKKQKNRLLNTDREIAFLNQTHNNLLKEKENIEKAYDLDLLNSYRKPEIKIKNNEEKIPGMVFYSSGYKLIVGRKANDNDALLRRYVKGNDYWLHARDYPGAYVFIKTIKSKSIPLEVLLDAGTLAVFYSKGKSSGQGNVYYTQVKYLRRPKNGKKGLVIPTQEKNLFIKLEDTRLKGIFKSDYETLDKQ
jgi:predicted ribosome quality control (RQC) complex YloA/Tae2 family protein